jgi:hypothetical protein
LRSTRHSTDDQVFDQLGLCCTSWAVSKVPDRFAIIFRPTANSWKSKVSWVQSAANTANPCFATRFPCSGPLGSLAGARRFYVDSIDRTVSVLTITDPMEPGMQVQRGLTEVNFDLIPTPDC